jgi:Fe-S-cluster containining protein
MSLAGAAGPPGSAPDADLVDYRRLVARVDARAEAVRRRWPAAMRCRRGCDGCCRHLSVFPVEAAALRAALEEQPPEFIQALAARAGRQAAEAACPLLVEHACALYTARPIICRTQGLPLAFRDHEALRVDVCPLNFRSGETLTGEDLLDLDRLNQTLAAVNTLFVRRSGGGPADVRTPLAEVLRAARQGLPRGA